MAADIRALLEAGLGDSETVPPTQLDDEPQPEDEAQPDDEEKNLVCDSPTTTTNAKSHITASDESSLESPPHFTTQDNNSSGTSHKDPDTSEDVISIPSEPETPSHKRKERSSDEDPELHRAKKK